MAGIHSGGSSAAKGPRGTVWRSRFAVFAAIALVAAGLLLLERTSASAASGPRVVHQTKTAQPVAPIVDARVTSLNWAGSKLQGVASLLTQTIPDLDQAAGSRAADLATSAQRAAGLSQQVASDLAKDPAGESAALNDAAQLQAALVATEAKALAANTQSPTADPLIAFCDFTIQVGPITVGGIVIGPFLIHFRAPCFLSGLIPTHIPPPTTTTTTPICKLSGAASNGLVTAAAACTTKKFPIVPTASRTDVVFNCVILVGANLTSGACDPVTTMAGTASVQVACTGGAGAVSGTIQVEHADATVTTSTFAGRCP